MSKLQDRMAELMAETTWTVGEIAERAGVSSSAVSQWVNGQTRSIALEPAIRLERESGLSALWLANGKGPKKASTFSDEPSANDGKPELAGAARGVRWAPIAGTAKLGNDDLYELQVGGAGHVEIATQDPNTYGLRVRGQSLFPAIRDGWYVLVEPNSEPGAGEYVLLKLNNGQTLVKELLIRRPGSYEVMSVNGGVRMTFDVMDIESVQAVGAVVSPSKWKPD